MTEKIKLYPHQKRFLDENPDKVLMCWETGTGKGFTASGWLTKNNRDTNALVICPKQVKKKWQDELYKWKANAKVVSKEEFKKMKHEKYSAIVVDEADEFASPLFIAKKRSQRSEHLYNLFLENKDTPRLLLTATPIRSNPWNLHSLLTFKGAYTDYKKWQSQFFTLQRRPYLPRPAWMPKPDWREQMRPILEENADIVLMKDIVELPKEETIEIPMPVNKVNFNPQEWEPAKAFHEERKYEQAKKIDEIKDIAKGYRKVLVVAYYVEQCREIKNKLDTIRQTFLVYGRTKNAESELKQAQESDECFLIVQASLGAGFDADTFSCVIFASMSYSVRDYIQMKGRVRRIHNLQPVKYYHLLAGRCDEAVWKRIKEGFDFVPSAWEI